MKACGGIQRIPYNVFSFQMFRRFFVWPGGPVFPWQCRHVRVERQRLHRHRMLRRGETPGRNTRTND